MNNHNPEPHRMLAVRNPVLAREWHPTRNGKWTPFNTAHCSSRKVWWRCSIGHEWLSTVDNRTHGNGCPYCSGTIILLENSISTLFPKLMREWHPTGNGALKPETIGPHSMKRCWWVCDAGHEWQAVVGNRTKGATCPHCAGKAFTAERCLAVRFPEMVPQWHHDRNGEVTPFDVTYGMDIKVWWRCAKGHEWEAVIKDRTGKRLDCPYCSGKRASEENNFAVLFPELALAWHPARNGKARPWQFRPSSAKKVWWRCPKGHEWRSDFYARVRSGKCPYCSGRKVGPDNNLEILHPELSKEWHPTRNAGKTPVMFRPGSTKKVWWRCRNGHEWPAQIKSRVKGTGCSQCPRIYRSIKPK